MQPSIETVIVDDEALARDELAFLLRDYPEIELAGAAANGIEAVHVIQDLEPDLVFLDIQMPGLDGLGVIRRLREVGPAPLFVLTTAFDNYAVEAFRWEALDYLLKPVDRERLALTMERVRKLASERPRQPAEMPPGLPPGPLRQRLLIRNANRNFIINAEEIVYATIDEGSITIVTPHMRGESNFKTIEELQASLDPQLFWRVHRSYLVNINRIREVIPWFKSSFQLRMDDRGQTEIPVSRVQTKRLRALFRL